MQPTIMTSVLPAAEFSGEFSLLPHAGKYLPSADEGSLALG